MFKYIKVFDNHYEYEQYRSGEEMVKPNVSFCIDANDVHYNELVTRNLITYKATAKLSETLDSEEGGLHTNAFDAVIKYHLFENGVGKIIFEEDVTQVKEYAFKDCVELTDVTLPNSIVTIERGAFRGCIGLTRFVIPDSVTSLGGGIFSGCRNLETLFIGDGITSVPSMYFYHGTLKHVFIGNGVTSIGQSAFAECGLTSVNSEEDGVFNLPTNVTNIGSGAFSYAKFTSVFIPDTVTSIGNNPFSTCNDIEEITVDSNNNVYDSRNDCNAIIETATNTLILGCENTVIPNDVTSIEGSGFNGCHGLTSITIPNSVTSIGEGTFGDCDNLISITIPGSVTSIGNQAFSSCNRLTSVTFGEGVISIGTRAFSACSIISVEIPSTVTNIGSQAFSGCMSLLSVTVKPTTPPTLGTGAFSDNNEERKIYVPSASVNTYKEAAVWSTYADAIESIE